MKKLIIFGGSGIGMIAAYVAYEIGYYDIIGFLNDEIEIGEKIGKYNKYPVIGRTEDYSKYLDNPNIDFFIGYVAMLNEQNIYNKIINFAIPSNRYATLIHPTAVIPKGFCKIGNGVLLAPLSQLSPDTTISDNCIILGNSFIGHDSYLERFAHVATNGVVGSNVHIGKAVHIGSNATLREKINIGDFALIGSGSVVLNNVEPNTIVVGNPAKILRKK
jgi:acetyltransferase EpsM